MGGGGKGSSSSTSTFQPPAFALAGGQQAIQTAQQLAQTPFSIPTQPIAGFQPQQAEAFQEVENAQGMTNPYFNTGAGLELAGSQPNIGQYFGAESAGVVPELNNIFGQQMAQTTGNLTQEAGGVGADRIAIGQAELANQQGLSAGQTLSQIMQQSVSQAQAGAGLEQSAGTNIAGMGTAAQNAALQGATAELQSGTTQQQQQQNQQNAQYENILQQISWPFQTNQYLGSMSAGVTPVLGGTGITSGQTKSSMMNTGGLGKGATALGSSKGMGLADGGSVPWMDEEDGEGGPSAFGNRRGEFAFGGAVDPLEIATGNAPSLPIPMQGGGNSDGPNQGGFNFVPLSDTTGGFAPATGQVVEVPFGPDFGGSQPLELTSAGVPPAPNVQPGNFSFASAPSGLDGLNVRGPQGAPTFENAALSPDKGNPFAGLLQNLYAERGQLMGAGVGAGLSGAGAKAPAGKRSGGRIHADTGASIPLIFGQNGNQSPSSGGQQSNTSSAAVGNLLGSDPANPAGGKTVMGQTMPQGRPSPMMQWAMQNHAPKAPTITPPDTKVNPFLQHPHPSDKTMNDPGQTVAAPGAGKGGPGDPFAIPGIGGKSDVGDPAVPDQSAPDQSAPMAFDFSPAEGDIFAARGGAIHLDTGGDPLSEGMSTGTTPFSPQGEISGSVIPYSIESSIYNQPFQTAQNGNQSPQGNQTPTGNQTPFSTGQEPTPEPTAEDFTSQMSGTAASPFSLPPPSGGQSGTQGGQGGQNTDRIGTDQAAGDREQAATKALAAAAAKPIIPSPQPRPAGAPGAPGAGGAVPAQPQLSPAAQRVLQMQGDKMLSNVFGPMWKMGAPDGVADAVQGKTVGQLLSNPQTASAVGPLLQRPEMQTWLRQVGVTPQDLGAAMKAPAAQPQTGAPPSPQTGAGNSWQPQGTGPYRYGAGIVPMDAAKYAIGTFESGNNYQNVGPQTRLGHALGKYQVMEAELPQQLANSGLPPMSARDFLHNPQAQEKLFEHEFGGLMQKYGSFNEAASRWFSGRSVANGTASGAKDVYKTDVPKYLSNTNALLEKYATGSAPERATPDGGGPSQVAGGPPVPGTAGRYGPPPGLPPISAAAQFLTTLGTGDPTALTRTKLLQLKYYQEAADWDAMRNAQYGPESYTPQQAGTSTANDLMKTRGIIGKIAGAPELRGEPGTVSGDAAAGHTASSPGATVTTPSGAPPANAAAAGAPPIASGAAGAPMNQTEQMLDKGMKLLASGNPRAIAAGNQVLNGMVQRGLVDAETLQKRMEAAKLGIGYMPGLGPYRLGPNGEYSPLLPNQPQFHTGNTLPPPSPGSMPTGTPGSGAPAAPLGAPTPGAAPPAPPSGGAPTPLPSGAGPETMPPQLPASGRPAAKDFLSSDPAFQPLAKTPSNSMEMANNPRAAALAQDERAWTPQGQEMIKEEAKDKIKDASGHINSDRTADMLLSELEEQLNGLPKTGISASGPTMPFRQALVSHWNDFARVTAPVLGKDALPQINMNEVASVEQINKLSNTLAFALARTLGSREAVQIVQQARQSVPSADVSPQGARKILENLRAGISMDRDYYNGMQDWSSANLIYGSSLKNYDRWFTETHPTEVYAQRAQAAAARDDQDRPINANVLAKLRANPQGAQDFNNTFHTTGLAEYYLRRWGLQ